MRLGAEKVGTRFCPGSGPDTGLDFGYYTQEDKSATPAYIVGGLGVGAVALGLTLPSPEGRSSLHLIGDRSHLALAYGF